MTIRSALRKAFKRYDPTGHLFIQVGSVSLVWSDDDGKWHMRPGHGIIGRAVPLYLVMKALKVEGGYISVEEPPFRQSDRPKPEAWRQVYLVGVEPGGKTYEMQTA